MMSTTVVLLFCTLLWLICGINGQANQLTGVNPTTCGHWTGLMISNANFKYYRYNNTLEYILMAVTDRNDVSPFLRIDVKMYQRSASPQIIDLCNGVTSCPLPQSTPVTINGSWKLNETYTSNLPPTVWTAPDLDGSAMLLVFASPTEIIACVRMGITNGKTSKTKVVGWTSGIVAVVAAIAIGAAGVATATHAPGGEASAKAVHGGQSAPHPSSTAPLHGNGPAISHMDPLALFSHFQFISSSGLLSLKYPQIYGAFTTNFAWANFILPIAAFGRAAEGMRKCDIAPSSSPSPSGAQRVDSGLSTAGSSTSGIPAYAAKLGISQQDIFGIAFLVFLSVCALLLVVIWAVSFSIQMYIILIKEEERKNVWKNRRTRWQHMSSNNVLRLMNLALGTLATFAFFQLTQKCTSAITAFCAAIILCIILGLLGFVSFLIVKQAFTPHGRQYLFLKDSTYARRWGTLYDTLAEDRVFFVVPFLFLIVIRSAVIGFGQSSGLGQVAALTSVEAATFFLLFVYEPYYHRGYNRINYALQGCRVASNAILLLFADEIKLSSITSNIWGYVLLSFHSLIALALLILTVAKLGWGVLWYRKTHSALEKKTLVEAVRDRRSGVLQDQAAVPTLPRMSGAWPDHITPYPPDLTQSTTPSFADVPFVPPPHRLSTPPIGQSPTAVNELTYFAHYTSPQRMPSLPNGQIASNAVNQPTYFAHVVDPPHRMSLPPNGQIIPNDANQPTQFAHVVDLPHRMSLPPNGQIAPNDASQPTYFAHVVETPPQMSLPPSGQIASNDVNRPTYFAHVVEPPHRMSPPPPGHTPPAASRQSMYSSTPSLGDVGHVPTHVPQEGSPPHRLSTATPPMQMPPNDQSTRSPRPSFTEIAYAQPQEPRPSPPPPGQTSPQRTSSAPPSFADATSVPTHIVHGSRVSPEDDDPMMELYRSHPLPASSGPASPVSAGPVPGAQPTLGGQFQTEADRERFENVVQDIASSPKTSKADDAKDPHHYDC